MRTYLCVPREELNFAIDNKKKLRHGSAIIFIARYVVVNNFLSFSVLEELYLIILNQFKFIQITALISSNIHNF